MASDGVYIPPEGETVKEACGAKGGGHAGERLQGHKKIPQHSIGNSHGYRYTAGEVRTEKQRSHIWYVPPPQNLLKQAHRALVAREEQFSGNSAHVYRHCRDPSAPPPLDRHYNNRARA